MKDEGQTAGRLTVTVRQRRSAERRRVPKVDSRLLGALARDTLRALGATADHLSILLVDDPTIAQFNRQFHQTDGPTDVLSFDYSGRASVPDSSATPCHPERSEGSRRRITARRRRRPGTTTEILRSAQDDIQDGCRKQAGGGGQAGPTSEKPVTGELIISIERAVAQARRFRSTPARELALYLVHGILHLHAHDDRTPAQRRAMHRTARQLLARLARAHPVARLVR